MKVWFYAKNDERLGPVSQEEIESLLRSGGLDFETGLVWREGLAEWAKPASLPEFQNPSHQISAAASQLPTHATNAHNPYSSPMSGEVTSFSPEDLDDLPDIAPGSELLDTSSIIGRAFHLTKRYFGILLGASAILWAISILYSLIFENGVAYVAGRVSESNPESEVGSEIGFIILTIFIQILGQVLTIYLTLGFTRFGLNFVSGKEADIHMLFGEGRLLLRAIAANILYALAVVVGLLLLIIPGIYVAVRLSQFQNAMVDRNMGIQESLNYSFEITRGNFWQLVGFSVVVFLINLLGMIVLCVGLLFTIPMSYAAGWLVYRWLQKGRPALSDRGLLARHPQASL